jgi:ER membrane protein complex subunit 7
MPGTPLNPPSSFTLPYPLTLQARRKLDFFVPEASFNVMGMFQNPMMLMMGVTAIVVLALPYLLVSPN